MKALTAVLQWVQLLLSICIFMFVSTVMYLCVIERNVVTAAATNMAPSCLRTDWLDETWDFVMKWTTAGLLPADYNTIYKQIKDSVSGCRVPGSGTRWNSLRVPPLLLCSLCRGQHAYVNIWSIPFLSFFWCCQKSALIAILTTPSGSIFFNSWLRCYRIV